MVYFKVIIKAFFRISKILNKLKLSESYILVHKLSMWICFYVFNFDCYFFNKIYGILRK